MTGQAGSGAREKVYIRSPPPLLRQRDNKYKITHMVGVLRLCSQEEAIALCSAGSEKIV